MSKYFFNIFHAAIITALTLSFSGCGKKGAPIYVPDKVKTEKSISKSEQSK